MLENTSSIYVTRLSPMIAKLALFLYVRLHSSSLMYPEVSSFIGTFRCFQPFPLSHHLCNTLESARREMATYLFLRTNVPNQGGPCRSLSPKLKVSWASYAIAATIMICCVLEFARMYLAGTGMNRHTSTTPLLITPQLLGDAAKSLDCRRS